MQYKTEVGKSFGYNTQIKDLTIVTKPSYYYLTSTIYPLEFLDGLSTSVLNTDGRSSHKDDLGVQRFNQDTTSTSFTDISGTLKVALKVYEYSRTEEDIDKVQGSVSSVTGVLRLLLFSSTMKVENTLTSFTGISGVLRSALIAYNFYKQESTLSLITALEAIYINVQTSFESYVKGTSTVYSYPVVMNNVMFTSTVQTMSFSTSTLSTTDTSGYTLVFREPLSEVDAKNVVLIFGREQSNLPKDPEVIINEYTTSALDFENDLIDKVSTTVWNKEGTGNVTSVNKIFGSNSFETKALGDSLYTSDNIITGGSTPFTIEFYALVKSSQGFNQYVTLLSSNNNIIDGAQFIYLHPTNGYKLSQYRGANGGSFINGIRENSGYQNIKFNEINKYTITYDGAALRYFVNDKYDLVLGTSVGYSQNNLPFSFLNTSIPVDTYYDQSTQGLIDNINIFDGVATKVRDYDEHADKLIIDLAFDGENNSTKIVDNGTLKSNWSVNSNAKISTDQKFDGFSSLKVQGGSNVRSNIDPLYLDDFTICFDIYTASFTSYDRLFQIGVNSTQGCLILYGIPNTNIIHSQIVVSGTSYSNIVSIGSSPYKHNSYNNIRLTRNNGVFKFYVNNILLETNNSFTTYNVSSNFITIGANSINGEGINAYIKNFKIYRGVAIVPENPTGKIQLDFDNNVIDRYNNSTWTNNGVTFDQVNSVKGYSSFYSGTSNISTTRNSNLNFENKNFNINMDIKPTAKTDWAVLIASNTSNVNVDESAIFWTTESNQNKMTLNMVNNSINYITVGESGILLNNYYNVNASVVNNVTNLKINDVIISQLPNLPPTRNFNFNFGDGTKIGTNVQNTSYVNYKGYIDNFKSHKDSLNYITKFESNVSSTTINLVCNDELVITHNGTTVKNGTYVLNDSPIVKDYIVELNGYIPPPNIGYLLSFKSNTSDYSIMPNDQTAGYSFAIVANVVIVYKGQSSTTVTIDSKPLPSKFRDGKYHIFKVIKSGNSIKVYIDDELISDVNDTSYSNNASTFAFSYSNSPDSGHTQRSTNIKYFKVYDLNKNILYDNHFKSNVNTIIDKSAVHLPLETNAINTGFTPLTINSVGNPTYTTIDGKKCIKFESGKYLTINSNNIFNLGTNSDFYIEFDFYVIDESILNVFLSNHTLFTNNSSCILYANKKIEFQFNNGVLKIYPTVNTCEIGQFNNFKLYRMNNAIYMNLNGVETIINENYNINFSISNLFLGKSGWSSTDRLNGYMSNFKMFVGTSEIPENYNDKKVLDLTFEPTRKSYLFKDKNNKCIIHPVNITQRDYQDSQYCCSFNGTNQYLQLGKNELLNFGNDDFIIAIKFKVVSSSNTWNTILSGASTYTYIDIQSNGTLHVCLGQNSTSTVGTIPFNTIVTLIISVKNNILSVYVNNVKVPMSLTSTSVVNFNESNNTFIGAYGALSTYFNGSIYSIKVLRNTTDLTLLESEEESGGGEDNYTPITLSLNTPSTVENPVEGSYTNIYGVIRYADLLPTVTVMFNGNEVNQSDITLTSRGTINAIEQDYDLQIRILNDALDGTYPVTVTVDDTSDVANGSTNLTVIRDYPLLTQGIDSFNTSWYQLSSTNKVGMRNYQEELMMYFNGLSSLTANGYSWKFGLDQFTIELDFALTKSPTTNNYHILSCGKTESWYAIEITSNIEIRFLNRGTVKVSTTTNAINVDTKYRLAISRDSNYNLRIFLNGIKVAEAVDNSNYTFDEDTSDLNHNVFLGRDGTLYTDTVAEKHFKGYMKNFYFNKGVCLYTENYTPTVLDKGITTKSLLTFTSDDVGFTTKVDSFNPNITWTNSGCTVVNNQLVLGSVSNRLVSTENDLFNFTNQNWTIDIIGTTSQITTEAVLFDNRLSGSSFNGILIRQSPSDPTSLTISLGISTATTGYSYIINTGVNSLVANTEFNLKVVRSLGQLAIFFNGVRKNRTTIYTNSFETSKTVCIGNNKDFNKGFNGKIKQVRIINGIATDVHAYPVIEGDILT